MKRMFKIGDKVQSGDYGIGHVFSINATADGEVVVGFESSGIAIPFNHEGQLVVRSSKLGCDPLITIEVVEEAAADILDNVGENVLYRLSGGGMRIGLVSGLERVYDEWLYVINNADGDRVVVKSGWYSFDDDLITRYENLFLEIEGGE